jgi:hypothetical protein
MVDAAAIIYTLLMLLLTSWHAAAARWTGYLTRASSSRLARSLKFLFKSACFLGPNFCWFRDDSLWKMKWAGSHTLLTFSNFSFLYLLKCIIYRFKTLCTIKILQLKHDKNSSGFFCAVWNFRIYKIQRISLNAYIFNVIKILKYFSHILSQMFRWTAKFQI